MVFAAIIDYGPDASKITEFRPQHREYLRGLVAENKLVISGPFADDTGGLLVYNADSEAEVDALIQADPFHKCGVFQTWKIRPWKIVMANRELLP
jgi:uncharacterized protein YciI